jgi:hypothetical protein
MRYVNDSMIVNHLSIPPPSSLGQLAASPDVTSPEIGHRPGRAKRPKESHQLDRKLVCIVPCIPTGFPLEFSNRATGQDKSKNFPVPRVIGDSPAQIGSDLPSAPLRSAQNERARRGRAHGSYS